ncbi:amino acid ABC transporter substrate-binding protein [Clostridium vincentii]|uniref:Glutamine-binding periplasmic protein n=1 Tax=Clostridium vincentii TaxID=52704 RepID=A0A2T0BEB4_9CLOT|nr:amino acid ABC transporter substrate-binding protein [Clostridium vincentii]PRR82228.1 Glutamine-binding periplasmic protein precursor [Clostridium vincentii]
MKIKSLFKKGLILSMIGVLAVGMVACGTTDKESSTMDKDTLVLGFDDTFVPMGFKDDDGSYTGFDIELAKEVAKKLDKEITFQPIDWTMKETELNNGNIDFIWNGFSVTDERKEVVDFSKAYLKNRQVIITLADSSIKTKEDLKGKTVVAQDQSSSVEAIGDYKSNFKELVTLPTNDDALRDLEAGRSDAVVADEILVRYYINLKGADKYKILEDDFGTEEYAVGMRKDDTELVDALNNAYDEVVEDGIASEIAIKWFGEDIIQK